jgi:hypothetical protein
MACIAAGLYWLWAFSYKPGAPVSNAPPTRPAEFPASGGAPTLVVFVHPRCSCSEATIEELARIRTRNSEVDIRVFVLAPAETPESWTRTALWEQAARIPGVQVASDPGGQIALRYGANTSGQALLYDSGGRLAFAGGLTASRGHYGDSDGSEAVLAVLGGMVPRQRTTPVYGCSLRKTAG